MTLEITNGKSKWSYRINANYTRQIWRRLNRLNGRWELYCTLETPEQARREMLRLERAEQKEGGK